MESHTSRTASRAEDSGDSQDKYENGPKVARLKLLVWVVQGVLVALCFWWLSRDVDWGLVLEYCTEASPAMLLLVFAQRYTPYAMLGARLAALFPVVNAWTGFQASVLCVGCNTILPARMGELVKIVWLHGLSGLCYGALCGGVFWERLMDVSALLLLVLLFALPHANVPVMLASGLGLAVLWIFLIQLANPQSHTRRRLAPRLPVAQSFFLHLCAALEACTNRRIFFRVLAWTMAIWAMNFLHVALLVNGLMGINLAWHELGLVCVTLFFSSALLLAPGGVGVMEAAVVVVLTLLGVDKAQGASTAIFFRLFYSVPPLLGALAVAANSGRTLVANLRESRSEIANIHTTCKKC